MKRIEIFNREQRHRRYTPQEKSKFVVMSMQPVTRRRSWPGRNELTLSLLLKWKKLMHNCGMTVPQEKDPHRR